MLDRSRSRAFTLVELLVVIGIIALLISILLPALGAARRQSQAVKCLTQLREIGNAFNMYAIDSKGYYPPSQLRLQVGSEYSLDGTTYYQTDPTGIYWFNFLNKYVSKAKMGRGTDDTAERDLARKSSVIWGCPNWDGYPDTGTSPGTNPVQVGYGMNGHPSFMPDYPRAGPSIPGLPSTPPAAPPDKEWSWNNNGSIDYRWSQTQNRSIAFVKQRVYGRMGASRLLVADSRFWVAESGAIPATGVIPNQMPEVNVGNVSSAQTSLSMWRHGKLPQLISGSPAQVPLKGKIAYNILYCDGHVATTSEPAEAYRSIRMKFPG